MPGQVDPVPAQYPGVCPYLIVDDAAKALEFYKSAFGATEGMCLKGEDGRVMHAEVRIGKAVVMFSGEWPDMGHRGPKHFGGTPLSLCIYVPDVDAFAERAERAGAEIIQPLENKFYGDRAVTLRDPFGHVWAFMTHIEEVSPEEMKRRMAEMMPTG